MKKLNKNAQVIYDLLEQELANDEKQPLKTNTEVCEEEGYNFVAGKDMPQSYQCGGIANVGKYLRVAPDGYVRPMAGQGGEGGYEPDFATIELTDEETLAVVDYISASSVDELIDATKVWVEDNFCLESFAVELDERVEELEEELTVLTPKVERALLTPLTTPTAPELVGIGTDKSQLRVKIGSGLTYNTSTDTLSATGGGGDAEPVYVITGRAVIEDPTSLERIPITITSPNYYTDLISFYNENGRFPRVIADIELVMGTETISTVELDMFSNNVRTNEIDFQGALVETSRSVSYIELNIEPTEQGGELSSFALQSKLTEDSEFSARKINIGSYFVTETVMQALNNLLSKAVLIDTNQDISGTKTFTSSFGIKLSDTPNLTTNYKNGSVEVNHTSTGNTDYFNFPNKDGGTYTLATTDDLPSTAKSYLHCIELIDNNDNRNFYLRFINHSNTTYTSWSQVINETKKMWGWGRTNQEASTYHRYDLTVMGDNGTLLFIDEENNTLEVSDLNITDFIDRGVVEL